MVHRCRPGRAARTAQACGCACCFRAPSTPRSPDTRASRAALARLIRYYEYDETQFFSADDAPAEVAAQRRAGFMQLAQLYAQRFAKGRALTREVAHSVSDLQFTLRYRVPFQFSRMVRQYLPGSTFLESSSGVTVTDVDGNRFFDVSGSYGVNLFGYDFYKECIERGAEQVRALGPVLGAYHPLLADNVRRLREISGLDEVSFHMSGTEAVMQAVRLARYHTRRRYLVRFCGAYHGWWGDVQPGVGQPAAPGCHLHAEGHGCGDAAGAAHAARHRLRAGESRAGDASQCERAGGFGPDR